EAASMNSKLAEVYQTRKERGTHKAWIPHPPITFPGTTWDLERISRYEVTNERSLHRALMMLERRQARRRNEPVPAPIAVHVEGRDNDVCAAPIAVLETLHPALALPFQDDATTPAEPSAEQLPEIAEPQN